MARPLEQRLRKLHKTASVIVTVLGNVQARTPGTFPENLDDMHRAIKRGELRRIFNCAQNIVDEVEAEIPAEDLSPERLAKRAERQAASVEARAKKKAARKKTAKKKTG